MKDIYKMSLRELWREAAKKYQEDPTILDRVFGKPQIEIPEDNSIHSENLDDMEPIKSIIIDNITEADFDKLLKDDHTLTQEDLKDLQELEDLLAEETSLDLDEETHQFLDQELENRTIYSELVNEDLARQARQYLGEDLGLDAMDGADPFQGHTPKTEPQYTTYSHGNLPPRPAPILEHDSQIDYKARGKRQPFDGTTDEITLNLGRYTPQVWPEVISRWKNVVIQHYLSKNFNYNAEQMIRYLETFLGPTARRLWDEFKRTCPKDYNRVKDLGANPYNFVNIVGQIITAQDPNMGSIVEQEQAMRALEQLRISSFRDVQKFLQDYMGYATLSGNGYSEAIIDKMVLKLPGQLGLEIQAAYQKWKATVKGSYVYNISAANKFINDELARICRQVSVHHQIKKAEYQFCREFYTPQTYGQDCNGSCSKPKRKQKDHHTGPKVYFGKNPPSGKKQYFLRKSRSKKPYLDQNKHVTRYRTDRQYNRNIVCFICGRPGHTARNCPNRINIDNKATQLVDNTNMDLIQIDEKISDTESIYSIVSIDLPDEESDSSISDEELQNRFFQF